MYLYYCITLNLHIEIKTMEKKIYSRPTISETRLDSEINLVLMSCVQGDPGCSPTFPNFGMGLDGTNETDGNGISQFMNPLKWFR